MRILVRAGVVLALALDCANVHAQSLADAARKAEEKRKAARSGALVFDAGDLNRGVAWQELLDVALTPADWSRFLIADRLLSTALAADPELRTRMTALEVTSIRALERSLLREPALTHALASSRVDPYRYAAMHLAVGVALEESSPSIGAVERNREFLDARKKDVAGLLMPRATLVGRPVAPAPAPRPADVEPTLAAAPPAAVAPAGDSGGPIDARPGAEIPDFAFVDFNGSSRRLSDFRGRYVMLDFWGSWCGPCRREVPYAKAAYEKYRSRGFEIVGLDYEQGASEDDVRQMLQKNGVTWPFATPDSVLDLVRNRFKIRSFPTLILLDPQARVLDVPTEALRGGQLSRTLDAILPR